MGCERDGAGKGELSVNRWRELHSVIASAAARTEAERDNLPVSEIKGEKPKGLFHWQCAALWVMDTFLSACVWSSVKIAKNCIFRCFIMIHCDS